MAANDAREISIAGDSTDADEEFRLLNDVVRSFPPAPLRFLLSSRICALCILRLFGKYGPSYCSSSRVLSFLMAITGDPNHSETPSQGSDDEGCACKVCYGILEFIHYDEKHVLVKKDCAYDLAVSIFELAKQEGHHADGFSLEVSVPPFILENENSIRLLLKEKYSSEVWFSEMLESETILIKDALKISITKPLETLFGVKNGLSSFRVRLTYSSHEMPKKTENGRDCNQAFKKRKTGFGNRRCSNNLQDTVISENPLDRKAEACSLVISCYRMPIYIGGRYLKYSRNVSQTRWIIDDERMGEASIEEIVVGGIIPLFRGDNCKFHAAGREDIDVRMLGSGRPFLLEIQNPRVVPSELSVKEMEMKINTSPGNLVKVKNLKVVGEDVWTLMREGEAEKQKQYAALVWISRPLEDRDLLTISSLKELKLLQRTPVRVLHRRSPLEREKIVHWMKIEKIAGSTQYFLLHLCTQAGTYIKEFVHGDLGRTHPSIGSILGCRAEILQLDVTDVKMDCFL